VDHAPAREWLLELKCADGLSPSFVKRGDGGVEVRGRQLLNGECPCYLLRCGFLGGWLVGLHTMRHH
jgi:hypothetical protein